MDLKSTWYQDIDYIWHKQNHNAVDDPAKKTQSHYVDGGSDEFEYWSYCSIHQTDDNADKDGYGVVVQDYWLNTREKGIQKYRGEIDCKAVEEEFKDKWHMQYEL